MPHNKRLAAFTIVEILIVAPIVILVIGVFISAVVGMTGDVLASRGENVLASNIQDTLSRIKQDVDLSGSFLATNNITIASPQGYNNDTTAFHNADLTNGTMLILNAYATTSNPLSSTQNYVYLAMPNPCNSNGVGGNPPLTMNIIYFIKNNTLWRRVIMPSNYTTIGCSLPWQQPSCTPGVTGTNCKTQDIDLVDGVSSSGFSVSYYPNPSSIVANSVASDSGQSDTNRQTALSSNNTVGVAITATQNIAGRVVSQTGTIRANSQNNNTVTADQGVISSGMVLDLDAGSTVSYPGSGTTWYDLSGAVNNGNLYGGVTYSSANGGILNFDGLSGYVSCGNNSSLNISGSLTIGFWMRINSFPASGEANMVGKNGYSQYRVGMTTSGLLHTTIQVTDGTNTAFVDDYGGNYFYPSLNTFYYITYVFDSTNSKVSLYVNGNLFGSGSTLYNQIVTSSSSVLIGQFSAYFNGSISNVNIYNRVLSAAEIIQNFNTLRGRYGI